MNGTTGHKSNRRCAVPVAFACAGAALSLALAAGCRERKPEVEVISLEGSVEKVEARPDGSGKITVWYYSERAGKEVLGTGDVTAETEIMIDGAAGKLSDIRVGDRVAGEVRLERKGDERTLTALRIVVERPRPVEGPGG